MSTPPAPAPTPEILVDFPPRPGLKDVSLKPSDLAAKSAAAMDDALATIRSMATRVSATTHALVEKPQTVEVEFGIKLDAEAGALIARAGVEAHIVVTMTWGAGH